MRKNRIYQVVLVVGLVWLSWLGMMLVHETGHMLAAVCTGGHVQRLVWHPLVLSRTDVDPNPSPLFVVWGGPVFGSVLPVLFMLGIRGFPWRISYLFVFFAGFCALANGVYIGSGAVMPVGDGRDMLRFGAPRWTLAAFGLIATGLGLCLLDTASPRLGFGSKPDAISERDAILVTVIAIVVTGISIAIGNRGL